MQDIITKQNVKLKPTYRNIRLYEIDQVKEQNLDIGTVASQYALNEIGQRLIAHKEREHFLVVALNSKLDVIGTHLSSIGTLVGAVVSPREVFKFLLLTNAHSFAVLHNHPSGHMQPSSDDMEFTERLIEAGDLMNIRLIDHMIVVPDDYYSFASAGFIKQQRRDM